MGKFKSTVNKVKIKKINSRNCIFPQNSHINLGKIRKLGKITVFYAVSDGVVSKKSGRLLIIDYFGKERSPIDF